MVTIATAQLRHTRVCERSEAAVTDVASGSSWYMPASPRSGYGSTASMENRRASPRQHPRTRAAAPRLRRGLAPFGQLARPVLSMAPLDGCQLVL